MLVLRQIGTKFIFRNIAVSQASYATDSKDIINVEDSLTATEKWKKREQFTKSTIQRFEELSPKNYYAPEWELTQFKKGKVVAPFLNYGTTPEKWKYYNKVVWNPDHRVAETGLPKAREVFHVRESIHYQPKKMWPACQFVRGYNVDYAITQLRYKQMKSTLMLAEILEEAKTRARDEFKIGDPSKMFVAEAFPIQCNIITGLRRHARENWCKIRYRYINVFVRLEEGDARNISTRVRTTDGWEKMEEYYKYLRSRDFKYSL